MPFGCSKSREIPDASTYRTFLGIAIHNMSSGSAGADDASNLGGGSPNLSAAIRGEAGGLLGTSVVAGDLVSFNNLGYLICRWRRFSAVVILWAGGSYPPIWRV